MCELRTLYTAHFMVEILVDVMVDRTFDRLSLGRSMSAALGTHGVLIIDIVELFGDTRLLIRLAIQEIGDAKTQRTRSTGSRQATRSSECDLLRTDCNLYSLAQCGVGQAVFSYASRSI